MGRAVHLTAAFAVCVSSVAAASAASADQPTVWLDGLGGFRGAAGPGGGTSFLGVRFAVPPVGTRRFKPSELADETVYAPTEARDAVAYCPECPQGSLAEPADADVGMAEDCLCLNVWVPPAAASTRAPISSSDKPTASPLLPVLVFVHGGGFMSGCGSNRWTAGGPLAAAANVVVVTLNYRLGPLGFLVTDEPGALGNGGMNGIGDAVTALKWLQMHVSRFGGDPARITLSGQSSGSSAVCTLSVSPLAAGLFDQAITESGPCVGLWGPLNVSWGRAVRERLFRSLNVTSVHELRSVPAENISWPAPDVNEILFNGYFLDGVVAPSDPLERFVSGHINPRRWLFGANSMDGVIPYGYDCAGCAPPNTSADYPADLRAHWGSDLAPRVERQYPVSRFAGAASSAFVRADADGTVVCASFAEARLVSRANRTSFAYLFDYARGPLRPCDVSADVDDDMHSSAAPRNCTDPAECGEVGWASHALEIPFVWGTEAGASFLGGYEHQVCPFTPAERGLVAAFQGWFGRFVRGEDPAPAGSGASGWPAVSAGRGTPFVVNHVDRDGSAPGPLGPRLGDCLFWAREQGLPPLADGDDA